MRAEFAHEQAQAYLRQRNRFAMLAGVLGLTSVVSLGAAVTRDEQLVLVPITAERVGLSSAGVDAPYLELVTRDTELMLLNRAPESLDYWMASILKLADPAAHGRLKAELVQIVEEQRGSDISQAFVIARIEVDPEEIPRLAAPEIRWQVTEKFKHLQYLYVTLDLDGYRTGSMNAVLEKEKKR